MKIGGGIGKQILRETLARTVPRSLSDRPKTWVGVPFKKWRGRPLRDWADPLLSDRDSKDAWMLDGNVIQARWEQHVDGRRGHTREFWTVLMLGQWANRWC